MYEGGMITSVYVVTTDKNFVVRIADINNNKLIIPNIHNGDYSGINRDQIYYNKNEVSLKKGYIGICRWSSRVDGWIDSVFLKGKFPIEVIASYSHVSSDEIIDLLNREIEIPFAMHTRLVLYNDNGVMMGVRCSASDMKRTEKGIVVNDEVYVLPWYEISKENILVGHKGYNTPLVNLYYSIDLPESHHYLLLRDPNEAFKDILKKRFSQRFKKTNDINNSSQNFQILKNMLLLLSNSIPSEVSERCRCPLSVANKLWNDFFENIEQYIHNEDIETTILLRLLQNDARLDERLRHEWESIHESDINKKREKLQQELEEEEYSVSQLRKELEKEQNALEQKRIRQRMEWEKMQKEMVEAEDRLKKAKEEAEHYESLGVRSLESVRERLNLARKEASEFLADLAIFGSSGEKAHTAPAACLPVEGTAAFRFRPGIGPDDAERIQSVSELFDEVCYNLERAGMGRLHSPELAAVLLGAFFTKTSLFLAGPFGEQVADAFSCAVTGQHTAVLECRGEWDSSVMERILGGDDAVILVKEPFQGRWVDRLLPALETSEKMGVFVHPYFDDLSLEPAGIYEYALPILLDVFAEGRPDGDFVYCRMKGELPDRGGKDAAVRAELKKLTSSRYLRHKAENLLAVAGRLLDDNAERKMFLRYACILVPLSMVLRRRECLLENAAALPDELKDWLVAGDA